jgi:hypothetical protein
MEVKKLVYVYLMRYAEEQQDLALLSIATFQRGLKVIDHRIYSLTVNVYLGSESIDSCQCTSRSIEYTRSDYCHNNDVSHSGCCQ